MPEETVKTEKQEAIATLKYARISSRKVKIVADDHDLSYFNVTQNKYVRVCEGKIKVYIAENANISETKLMAQINAKY